MAKYKRTVVGSVIKSKDAGRPDYVKIKDQVTLKSGQILKLESKKSRLDSVAQAVKSGKMSEDMAAKVREAIEKTPEWVRFDLVLLEQE